MDSLKPNNNCTDIFQSDQTMEKKEMTDKSHPYWKIIEQSARISRPAESKPVTLASIYWKFAAHNFIHNR